MSHSDLDLAKKLQQEEDEKLAQQLSQQLNTSQPYIISRPPIHCPRTVVEEVVQMVNDSEAQRLAQKHGLNVVSVGWEDNARSKYSSWGPCISDMTLEVDRHRLPLIRYATPHAHLSKFAHAYGHAYAHTCIHTYAHAHVCGKHDHLLSHGVCFLSHTPTHPDTPTLLILRGTFRWRKSH